MTESDKELIQSLTLPEAERLYEEVLKGKKFEVAIGTFYRRAALAAWGECEWLK